MTNMELDTLKNDSQAIIDEAIALLKPNKPYLRKSFDNDLLPTKDISKLNSYATKFREDKEWDLAIECLFLVKEYGFLDTAYPAKTFTRLPYFLSQSGQFDEAKHELQWLLENVHTYAKSRSYKRSDNEPKTTQQIRMLFYTELFLATVFEWSAKIFKKHKDLDKASIFEKLSIECSDRSQAIREVLDQSRKTHFTNQRERLNLPTPTHSNNSPSQGCLGVIVWFGIFGITASYFEIDKFLF